MLFIRTMHYVNVHYWVKILKVKLSFTYIVKLLLQVWVEPLLLVLMCGTPLAQQHIQQHCLQSLFVTCPSAFKVSMSIISEFSRDKQYSNLNLLVPKLACLKSAVVIQSCSSLIKKHEHIVENGLCSADDQVDTCSSVSRAPLI